MRYAGTGLFKAFRKRRLPVSRTRSLPDLRRPSTHDINGVQPALYCGKDMIFYQCTKCGNETTETGDEERRIVGGGLKSDGIR
jgi:hypothetical protein